VDEVAAEVGIAKASLYKHFNSKEELACAAMVQAMQKAEAFLLDLNQAEAQAPTSCGPMNKLMATARWVLQLKLAGEMPKLHVARQFDGQQAIHGWLDEGQRYVGCLDFASAKRRLHQCGITAFGRALHTVCQSL
jgi:AcrR family transcriptional regulator